MSSMYRAVAEAKARGYSIMAANGDVPGHEFHGNQYEDARAEAMAASKEVHRSYSRADLHDKAQQAHNRAAQAATNPDSKAFHERMAKRYGESAEKIRGHELRMAEYQKENDALGKRLALVKQQYAELQAGALEHQNKMDELNRRIAQTKRATASMLREMRRDERS